jgi:hypothetical protein
MGNPIAQDEKDRQSRLGGLKHYNEGLASVTRAEGPLDVANLAPPVVVIPLRRLDLVGQKALRFALTISPEQLATAAAAAALASGGGSALVHIGFCSYSARRWGRIRHPRCAIDPHPDTADHLRRFP